MRDPRQRYRSGDWNVIDQRSGFKRKASEVRKEWDGLIVGKDQWEPRHPQDFVRGRRDVQTVPFTSSELTDKFVGSFTDPENPDYSENLETEGGQPLETEDSGGDNAIKYLMTE